MAHPLEGLLWTEASTPKGRWKAAAQVEGRVCRVRWFDGWRYGRVQHRIQEGAYVELEGGNVLFVTDPRAMQISGMAEVPIPKASPREPEADPLAPVVETEWPDQEENIG